MVPHLNTPEGVLGSAALVLLLALVAIRFGRRLGMPSLLIYLGIGLLLGEGGIGIEFSNTLLTEELGFVALVFILAQGGMTTPWQQLRPAVGLGVLLATVSFVVSTTIAALGVHLLFGFDWRTSLVWGAVLSTTDAAAVFSVLRGVGLQPRLSASLELEAGLGSASAILVVVLLAGPTTISWLDPLLLAGQLLAGALIGVTIGVGGVWLLRREAVPAAGLYPLAFIALIGGAYAFGEYAHASGFLATYITAVILGNARLPHRTSTMSFAEGFGWMAQIGLFVLLGLYVDPSQLGSAIVPGVLIGLFMLIFARPISVVAATLPFQIPWREKAFLSWAGLPGAVPIVLALIPLMYGLDSALLLLDVIVVVVVVYTLLQGTSISWVARRLNLIPTAPARTPVQIDAAPMAAINAIVLEFSVPPGSRMNGVHLTELRLPAPSTIALILRNGQHVPVTPIVQLQCGDQVLVIAPQRVRATTIHRLEAVDRRGPLADWFTEQKRRIGHDE